MGMSISLRNAEDRNWHVNLKLFWENRLWQREDRGPSHSLPADRPAGPCRDAPVSVSLDLFSLLFFCCVVLSLCLSLLLLSRLFGRCPTAKCQTCLSVRSPLPCGRTEPRLFQASPLTLMLERPSCANWLEKVKEKSILKLLHFPKTWQCHRIIRSM